METATDIFVIGGGINGTAIAADAAGRGLSVTLCEKGDLASATSSASTKLIHGGLRYLELYEFNLVRKALHERDILMRRAPNLILPLEFILPHEKQLRPAWFIRLGLFIYDFLSPRHSLPRSRSINLKKDNRGTALQNNFKQGFSYYDCMTDDARLVILNALSAQEHGATILTHTTFISAVRENNLWKIQLKNSERDFFCYAKAIINAAGPWVANVQKTIADHELPFEVELVKGSHIVVPKLYAGDFAYILQNTDKRIVFTIPYQQDFTLIGTTDIAFKKDAGEIKISDAEKNYLCDIANHYFNTSLQLSDIVWSYAGVRCLQEDDAAKLSEITRDYKLLLNAHAPYLLTVIGGKITTHRTLAEDALQKLQPFFPTMGKPWTANTPLPGSDFKINVDDFSKNFISAHPWLPEKIARRYIKNYGTRANDILLNTTSLSDLGIAFGAGLYQKEVDYLMQQEWANSADDILWRRSKLGLFFSADEIKRLEDYCVMQ